MNFAQPLSADTLVRAAVRVVLPWSMWPMVPTFTCGLLRSNFSLAMSAILALRSCDGADVQDRTGDLVLTKDALCQLSYIGKSRSSVVQSLRRVSFLILERETGIEPATNSLEGCDSTTELLPPTRLTCSLSFAASAGRTRRVPVIASSPVLGLPARNPLAVARAKVVAREGLEPSKPLGRQIYSLLRLTASLPRQLAVIVWKTTVSVVPATGEFRRRSWRRDSNPRPADYKSAALPD